jgi:tripartite-type tricarboxylate transporter receptor subunit TctC
MQPIHQRAARKLINTGIAIALSVLPISSLSQGYPSKPIRILVPLSAGSQTDMLARMIAPKMSEYWRQTVVVDNRPGGAGAIAGGMLVKSAADGHTLMLYSDGHAINAALNAASLPFDTIRDIARVSLVASFPSILVTSPDRSVRSVKELIALAKAKPGQLSFGSAGIGGGLHFSGEMFKVAAGIDATHIPYKGTPEALAETITGRIHYMFSSRGPALAFIRNGRLIALAVGSAQRSPLLPDVPTMSEAALPGFEYELWQGLFAPAATPRAIVDQISKEVARIMNLSDIREQLINQSLVHRANTPDEFDRFVRAEIDKLSNVVKVAGIKVQ